MQDWHNPARRKLARAPRPEDWGYLDPSEVAAFTREYEAGVEKITAIMRELFPESDYAGS